MSAKENKRIGGTDRAKIARLELEKIFQDISHPQYLAKDIEFAIQFDVTRHTIYKIREEAKIPPRSKRILTVLKSMDCSKYTLKELSDKLGLKYQNLYKVVTDNEIEFKKD